MNIRNFCLVAIMLLQLFNVNAQVEWQAGYSYDYFDQINSSRNLVYTFNRTKTPSIYYLSLYTTKGESLSTLEVPFKSSLKIKTVAPVGDKTVFYFIDNNTAIMLLVDKDGKELARNSFEDKQSFSYNVFIQEADANSFYVSRMVKGDKMGHTTEKFDLSLTKLWDYSIQPEKGRNQLVQAAAGKNGVVLMSKYLKNAFATEGQINIVFLDAAGKEISNTAMAELPANYEAYMMKATADGSVVIVADFGKTKSTVYPDLPLGVNIRRIQSNGTASMNKSIEFGFVQAQAGPFKEDKTPLYMEAPSLRVLDVIENEGKLSFVAESYFLKKLVMTPAAGTTVTSTFDADLTLGDIYIINDDDAELKNIHRIWKPVRTYQIRNFFSNSMSYIADELNENRGFSYQGTYNKMMYLRGYNHSFQYANVVAPAAHFEDVSQRVYFGKPAGITSSESTFLLLRTDRTAGADQFYNESMLVTPEGVLLYYFNSTTYKLHFSFIKF